VAGDRFTVSVAAIDASGNVATAFPGNVHFTSSDIDAVLPSDGGLTKGTGSFTVELRRAGTHTLTATDTSGTAKPSTVAVTVIAGKATTLALLSGDNQSGPPGALLAEPLRVRVTDLAGNPVSGEAIGFGSAGQGSISPILASTDAAGIAQAFALLGSTAGRYTYTAARAGLVGSPVRFTVTVLPGPATRLSLSGIPPVLAAGASASLTVKALDANGNVDTAYSGSVRFSSSDPSADLPVPSALTGGTATFRVVLKTAGVHSLSATDTVTPAVNGSLGNLVVKAVSGTRVVFTPKTTVLAAGASAHLDLQIVDDFGNAIAQATSLTVSANLAARIVFTALAGAVGLGTSQVVGTTSASGAASVEVTDAVAEKVTVTATGQGLTPGTAELTFRAGTLDRFTLKPQGSPRTVDCGCVKVDVQLEDRHGNKVPLALSNVALEVSGSAQLTSADLGDLPPTALPATRVEGTLRSDGGALVTVCDRKAEAVELKVSHQQLSGRTEKLSLTFAPGPLSAANTLFAIDATTLAARNGKGVVKIEPRSECGNPIGAGHKVTLAKSGAGVLSQVKDDGNGVYSATLTVPTCPDDPQIVLTATVNGVPLPAPVRVTVSCAPFSPTKTTVSFTRNEVTVCNDPARNQVAATLVPKDENGVNIGAKLSVSLEMEGLSGGAVRDNGDGTYTADFSVTSCGGGPRPIRVKVNGVGVVNEQSKVAFPCAKVDRVRSTAQVDRVELGSGEGEKATVSIAATNTCGEPGRGLTVSLSATNAVFAESAGVLDEAGSFKTTVSSPVAGEDVITATVDGVTLPPVPIKFLPPVTLEMGCTCTSAGGAPAMLAVLCSLGLLRRRRRREPEDKGRS
jgi:hypothetical protein